MPRPLRSHAHTNLLKVVSSLTTPIPDVWRVDRRSLSLILLTNKNPRKQTELDRMADVSRRLVFLSNAGGVFEMGGGKGILAETIRCVYRIPVVTTDSNRVRHSQGHSHYATQITENQNTSPVTRVFCRFPDNFHRLYNTQSNELKEDFRTAFNAMKQSLWQRRKMVRNGKRWMQRNSHSIAPPGVVLIGLHCCGALTDSAIALAIGGGSDSVLHGQMCRQRMTAGSSTVPPCEAFAVVPCCIHRLIHEERVVGVNPGGFYQPRSARGWQAGLHEAISPSVLAVGNHQHWLLGVRKAVCDDDGHTNRGCRTTGNGGGDAAFIKWAVHYMHAVALAQLGSAAAGARQRIYGCGVSAPMSNEELEHVARSLSLKSNPNEEDIQSILEKLVAAFSFPVCQSQKDDPNRPHIHGVSTQLRRVSTILPFSEYTRLWLQEHTQLRNGVPFTAAQLMQYYGATSQQVAFRGRVTGKALGDALVGWAAEWALSVDRACWVAEGASVAHSNEAQYRGPPYITYVGPVLNPHLSTRHVGIIALRDRGVPLLRS